MKLLFLFLFFSFVTSLLSGATTTNRFYHQQKKQLAKERLLSKHPHNKALRYSVRKGSQSLLRTERRLNKSVPTKNVRKK
tara:strand:+ start:706 stop:945 length:240 start_codon:yes stop_codon:yes gene_type:complete